jgi:sterol desaturase/sphingolipid hydroxylase (fatty acid hydroxylase superfamily)
MEKKIITIEQIKEMDLPPIIQYAIPVIFLFVIIEWVVSVYQKRKLYEKKDFFAALTIGVVNLFISASIKMTFFGIMLFFYNIVPWTISHTWWAYILCFIAIDFCNYWAHRLAHEKRFWWATHVTHHSSSYMNFSVAFRTGWTQHIKVVYFIPVPLIGFDPIMFFVCYQISILYQFIIHTEVVPKLPWLIEFLLVTPSHHRVHHGTNTHYIDKNYGAVLIIWDRLLGTFQVEDEKPVYGITKPVNSYNPVVLVFHEWVDIFKDLKDAGSFKEAWRILFSPPGTIVTEKQRQEVEYQENLKMKKDDAIAPENLVVLKQPVPIRNKKK